MRKFFFIVTLLLPFFVFAQQPGFRKLYSGEITGAGFMDVLWDGQKLITFGQFLTDTASNNAINGLLYMELDTNGNTLFTDIYFHPYDALAPDIGNHLFIANSGFVYSMSQMVYDTSTNMLAIYQNSERIKTVITPINALQSWLYHCISWGDNILLTGKKQNYQFDTEGMLIKSDPLGNEIWRKYYGIPNLYCGIAEPFIIDANTILLPGYKIKDNGGSIINKWSRTWMIAVDSLGNIKSEWESPNNVENGAATRLVKLPDGNWLYTTSEAVIMPGLSNGWGARPKIVCRDSNFNLVWERYIACDPSSINYIIDLKKTSDENYIAVGAVKSGESGVCFIHKFAPNGDSIWNYVDFCQPAFGCCHYLGGVTELPGGSVVAAGYHENIDEVKAYGLLIKLDSNGCLDTLCSGVGGLEGWIGTTDADIISRIKIYPNPTSDFVSVKHPIGERIEIVDLSGHLVRSILIPKKAEDISFQISDLANGSYIVRMQEKKISLSYQITKISR